MSASETIKHEAGKLDPRAQEPSMEEILASIRRIIADDQAPAPRLDRHEEGAGLRAALDIPREAATVEPITPEPVRRVIGGQASTPLRYATPNIVPSGTAAPNAANLVSPSFPSRTEPSSTPVTSELPVSNSEAVSRQAVPSSPIGHIAAPQFAMPDTPVLRGVAQQKRDGETDGSLLRFTPPADQPSPEASRRAEPARVSATEDAEEPAKPARDPAAGLSSSATDSSVAAAFNMLAATRLVENDAAIQDMVRDMIRPLLKNWIDDNLPSMVERLVRAEIERVGRGGR